MIANELLEFIRKSPTAFHAVDSIVDILNKEGFQVLNPGKPFSINAGGKYYITKNSSSIIAFTVGDNIADVAEYSFRIAASHSDSPCFKIKENAEVRVRDKYTMLNTEGYGGMLLAPWLDRPLSIAGRVVVRDGDGIKEMHICFDKDMLIIPNLAIHMNRKVNEGYAYNKQVDMMPLFGGKDTESGDFKKIIASEAGVEVEDILGSDLFLYDRTPSSVWGANDEFVSSPRLDDLECAYTSLMGFVNGNNSTGINVYACFDNEEVGSTSGQGAASTFMYDVLKRINIALGKSEEEYICAITNSFMLSCDNAHAVHPNHPEKTDNTNAVYMNEGVVIKSNANQKYTSDAISIAKFRLICEKAGVPYQFYANRSDEPGGSTLGNIAMTHVSVPAVDIGLPQLAMHSPYETAGVSDIKYMIDACEAFYS